MHIVRQHHDTARRIHHIIIEILRQPIPQLYRMVIHPGRFVIEIVRADNRRVSARIAAAQPAFFKHSNIGNAVFLGQIIGSRQPMPARANDNHIIRCLRLRKGPLLIPTLMSAHSLTGECKNRIFTHELCLMKNEIRYRAIFSLNPSQCNAKCAGHIATMCDGKAKGVDANGYIWPMTPYFYVLLI